MTVDGLGRRHARPLAYGSCINEQKSIQQHIRHLTKMFRQHVTSDGKSGIFSKMSQRNAVDLYSKTSFYTWCANNLHHLCTLLLIGSVRWQTKVQSLHFLLAISFLPAIRATTSQKPFYQPRRKFRDMDSRRAEFVWTAGITVANATLNLKRILFSNVHATTGLEESYWTRSLLTFY